MTEPQIEKYSKLREMTEFRVLTQCSWTKWNDFVNMEVLDQAIKDLLDEIRGAE